LPGGAFIVGQAVDRLGITDGGEVGIAAPVGQPLLDGLFHGGIILFGELGVSGQVVAQPTPCWHAHPAGQLQVQLADQGPIRRLLPDRADLGRRHHPHQDRNGDLTGDELARIQDADNSNGDLTSDLTSDELARIQDAVTSIDATIAPYGVVINEVSDPTQANVTLNMAATSALGGAAQGVLGCTTDADQVTMLQGWSWYAGSDPTQVGAGQYDFDTAVVGGRDGERVICAGIFANPVEWGPNALNTEVSTSGRDSVFSAVPNHYVLGLHPVRQALQLHYGLVEYIVVGDDPRTWSFPMFVPGGHHWEAQDPVILPATCPLCGSLGEPSHATVTQVYYFP
jgi:hypothetical protein